MSDNAFDRHLRQTLENLEPPYDASSWDLLQQKLDAAAATPGAEEAAVTSPPSRGTVTEQQMADFLRDLEAPYQHDHWHLLSGQLDQTANVRRIRWHKAAEAVLMLLLLVNLQSLLTGGAKLFRMPVPAEPQPAEQPSNRPIAGKHHGGLAQAVVQDNALSATTEITYNQELVTDSILSVIYPVVAESTLTAYADEATPQGVVSQLIGPDGQRLPAGLRPLTLLAMLGLEEFAQPQVAPTLAAAIRMPTTKVNVPGGERPYARIYAAWERNHTQFADEDLASTTPGNGAGVLVGARRGKWGVEAGVGYARRTYSTAKEIITFTKTGPTTAKGTSLDRVQADFVQVPVRGTRQLARVGRTKLVASAGATAHFAAGKKYRFRDYEFPLPPDPVPGNDQPAAALPTAESLLNGGALNENFYATADVGLRVEQPVTRRLTAFVEPTYSRAVTKRGVGPKSARTHSLAVQAGVMATL